VIVLNKPMESGIKEYQVSVEVEQDPYRNHISINGPERYKHTLHLPPGNTTPFTLVQEGVPHEVDKKELKTLITRLDTIVLQDSQFRHFTYLLDSITTATRVPEITSTVEDPTPYYAHAERGLHYMNQTLGSAHAMPPDKLIAEANTARNRIEKQLQHSTQIIIHDLDVLGKLDHHGTPLFAQQQTYNSRDGSDFHHALRRALNLLYQ